MHVNQSMSEDALPHTVSGSAPPAAQQPLALKTTPSVERLRGIDQTLRQTAQLVSLITGQLEANELNPATPAQEIGRAHV